MTKLVESRIEDGVAIVTLNRPEVRNAINATMQAELREGTHGIRSPRLAGQLVTYVKDDKGKHEPSPGSFSDLLMAYMQAKELRRVIPLRPAPGGSAYNSMPNRRFPWP